MWLCVKIVGRVIQYTVRIRAFFLKSRENWKEVKAGQTVCNIVGQELANIFYKWPKSKHSGLSGPVSVSITQPCCCSVKVPIGDTEMNEYGCVPVKLYFPKAGGGPDLALGPWGTKDMPVGTNRKDELRRNWDAELLGFTTPHRG